MAKVLTLDSSTFSSWIASPWILPSIVPSSLFHTKYASYKHDF